MKPSTTEFEISIHPTTGYLMPGDRIRVTVVIASVGGKIPTIRH